LAAVPDSVALPQGRFAIEAELWRSFMPGMACLGDMDAYVRLLEIDSLEMPAETVLDHIWVFYDGRWWSAEFTTEELPPLPVNEVLRMARCAPRWPVGATRDIIVRVLIAGETEVFLRDTGVVIQESW